MTGEGPPPGEENPWTRLESRTVYRNPWMVVREDRVLRPDGAPGIYGVMAATGFSTGVVALEPDGRVHLVGQYRYPVEVYSWELPEGGTHPGEPPLQAARRELREETGLRARHWEPLGGEIHLSNALTAETAFLFLATGLELAGEPIPEGTEVLRRRLLPLDEALRMADEGEIRDALTIVGLHRAWRRCR